MLVTMHQYVSISVVKNDQRTSFYRGEDPGVVIFQIRIAEMCGFPLKAKWWTPDPHSSRGVKLVEKGS